MGSARECKAVETDVSTSKVNPMGEKGKSKREKQKLEREKTGKERERTEAEKQREKGQRQDFENRRYLPAETVATKQKTRYRPQTAAKRPAIAQRSNRI